MPNTLPSAGTKWRIVVARPRKGRRSKNNNNNNNPELTQESLEEHNRQNNKKSPSPYYQGLTDSTRYLDRLRRDRHSSPGRESLATSSASSISTFFLKVQRLGSSCFRSPKNNKSPFRRNATPAPTLLPQQPIPRPPPTLSPPTPPTSLPVPKAEIRHQKEVRESGGGSGLLSTKSNNKKKTTEEEEGKPMRENLMSRFGRVAGSSDDADWEEADAKVFVWANKYRPNALLDFICNKAKAQFLGDLVKQGEFRDTHFIFEGPPGVGKRTMALAFIREAYGLEKLETRNELKEFVLKGEGVAKIKVKVKLSPQHIEISLSELLGYEKHVVMALLEKCDHTYCRAIVLYQAEMLSADAQHYIRWIVERYKSCSKIIFCCSDVSKLEPIRSICKLIQLLPPSNHEIMQVLEYIAEQEHIELPHSLAERISRNSKKNLRQAIRSFEATLQANYPFKDGQVILTGWEDDIANIARNIIKEQSPKQLFIIRGKLQNLIEHNMSPDFIFKTLVEELKKHLDEKFKPKIEALYQEYIKTKNPRCNANSEEN